MWWGREGRKTRRTMEIKYVIFYVFRVALFLLHLLFVQDRLVSTSPSSCHPASLFSCSHL
jgi:hypothetical protein